MNTFMFKRVRVSLVFGGCLIIFLLCYLRGAGSGGSGPVTHIRRFVHQHKKSIEESVLGIHHHPSYGGRKALHRYSNLWVSEDHPDSLRVDEMTHCKAHLMHKMVEIGLSLDKRDIRDMRHMNRTHEVDCTAYQHSSDLRRQVHANVLEMQSVTDVESVTMVTHLTSDRYEKLVDAMRHWQGPVSAAVYIRDSEDINRFAQRVCESYIEFNYKDFYLHFVKEEGVFYPVNYLRNTAINRVQTDYVFIMDVDFVPMPYLYETIHHYTRSGKPDNDEALIIPAFEVVHEHKFRFTDFPQHKAEAVHQWRQGDIRPFHLKIFEHGHKPTDFARWVAAKDTYTIDWKRWFEPYVVLRTDATPKFDKRFVERGYDKSSFMLHLHAMGFKFIVAHNCFILHTPHSLENAYSFKNMHLNKCSKEVYGYFLKLMEVKYNFVMGPEDNPK